MPTSKWYTSFWNAFDILRSLTCCLTPTYVANGSFGCLKMFIVSRTGERTASDGAAQQSLRCGHSCRWTLATEHRASIDEPIQLLEPWTEGNSLRSQTHVHG